MKGSQSALIAGALACALTLSPLPGLAHTLDGQRATSAQSRDGLPSTRHVLLISVDGLHAVDVARYVRLHPDSTLAYLAGHGVTYNEASTSRPSDSFPGLLAPLTGGSPKTDGVYYDDSYDRTLYAPGSNCQGSPGTEVVYDESIDKSQATATRPTDIDPTKLPLEKTATGCVPLYPHDFLRVNTIFQVIKQHRPAWRTAWSDKHPAYDLVNGPSTLGPSPSVDDLYTPEINGFGGQDYTTSEALAQQYDTLKVQAVLNEINGLDSTGTQSVSMPAVFGMNFQAVSVGQKLENLKLSPPLIDGYLDAAATPSPDLASALDFVDASLGKMVAALQAQHQLESTTIIVTAKHGQAPIDPNLLIKIDPATLDNTINTVQPSLVAQDTTDDIALIWLTDQSKTAAAVAALDAAQQAAHAASPPQFGLGIQKILTGDELRIRFGDPQADPRTPDIIVIPTQGVIYSTSKKKIAEHGGFNNDDTNVALVVSNPGIRQASVDQPVSTTQIAPTILSLLGLNPKDLVAVRAEGTQILPDFASSQEGDS